MGTSRGTIMISRLIIAAIIPAALAASAGLGVASAQYPPPVGNCVVTASATTVPVSGGSVEIKVTVRDLGGAPVAGEGVTFSIAKQPGSGAGLSPAVATTNASGVASTTLSTSAAPGTVEVLAVTEDVSCRTAVVIPGGAVSPAVELPETGGGAVTEGTVLPGIVLALVLGGIVLAVAGAKRRSA
ncbi:MAG: Ig-like domain-containing protein [Chloroflexi bacterium]|nr:Ig-like domain-containing protein [Chloroflexota bacterium]